MNLLLIRKKIDFYIINKIQLTYYIEYLIYLSKPERSFPAAGARPLLPAVVRRNGSMSEMSEKDWCLPSGPRFSRRALYGRARPAPAGRQGGRNMTTVFAVWNDNRATGIPLIDEQHGSILSAMNSLFRFLRKNDGGKSIVPLVTTLEQHIHLHFLTEENLLRETQYDDVEEHARHHAELLKRMKTLSAKLRHSGDAEELLAFLKTWWKEHIEVHDRAYTEHVVAYLRNRYAA